MRRTQHYALKGGLNTETPPLSLQPGEMLGVLNYELVNGGGARRIDGFERLDGKHSPSEADYWIVNFDSGSTAIVAGDIVSAVAAPTSSDKAGEVLANATVTSGTWAGGDAAGYFYVTRQTNRLDPDFANNDIIYVSAADVATANDAATISGAPDDATDETMKQTAIELLRDRIGTVTGSGNIRGVWMQNGVKYAFRDNAGGTACDMWKSSATGWTAVSLGRELNFTSGGTTVIAEGDTITGATSGATAVVGRVLATSGTWAGGDAAGRLILTSQTGTLQAENLNIGASLNVATIAGNSTAITLLPGGRYEFWNYNFYGSASTRRMYGCDGVNRAFEFDGTVFVPINTGMTSDTPKHIIGHKRHLFLMFDNGSVQHSPVGDPTAVWTTVLGASEIGTGDEGTGFVTLPNDTLGIFNRNSTYVLYGASSSDWNLTQFSDESGAIEWTIQRMGVPIYLDDRGLMDFRQSPNFGDFENSSFSQKIKSLINSKRLLAVSSVRSRSKDQYRIFFTDGTGIFASFAGRKLEGFTDVNYGKTFYCAASVEDTDGTEVLLFGSSDGYVYQLDKGTSFDGAAVAAFIRLPFNHIGSPEYKKRFFKAVVELTSPGAMTLSFTPDFTYGFESGASEDVTTQPSGGYWNIAEWDEFYYSDQITGSPEIYFDGHGKNVGILMYTNHTYELPHIIHGVTLHYSVHGVAR